MIRKSINEFEDLFDRHWDGQVLPLIIEATAKPTKDNIDALVKSLKIASAVAGDIEMLEKLNEQR